MVSLRAARRALADEETAVRCLEGEAAAPGAQDGVLLALADGDAVTDDDAVLVEHGLPGLDDGGGTQ